MVTINKITHPSNIINISIADADYYFKEILIKSLLNNPFRRLIKNCNNGYELINRLYTKQEDVFLIDLYMPILSGLETIKYIRNTGNSTPVIAYSPTYQDDVCLVLKSLPNIYYCQKKSVIVLDILQDYVLFPLKNYSDYLRQWATQSPVEIFEYMKRQKEEGYTPSLIEIQIMKLCYEGLNNKEIGDRLHLTSRTVDTYIIRLTKKLGLKTKIDLIRYCVERGYYNTSD